MIRRPGIIVAIIFALGALLGLATSAVFLDVDATEIRASAETGASARSGPIADLFLESLDEQDVFGSVADDLRADQIRNLLVAAAAAAIIAVGLGVTFTRRGLDGSPTYRRATTQGAAPTADRDPPRCPSCASR